MVIVDDEQDICILLSRKLQKKGYDASYAVTLSEGIELFRTQSPHYLILDHNLPDGYGLDNMDKFKNINPKVKIIVISALGQLEERAYQAGADLFMHKPLSFKNIEDFLIKN